MNETGTGCTVIGASNGAGPLLTYADGVGTKTAQLMGGFRLDTGAAAIKMPFTTVGTMAMYYSGVIRTDASAIIQIATSFIACTTPGPWTGYNIRAVIYPVSGQ